MERAERTGTGLVHLYYGDGKGKTTTGMGLCVRAAGYGYKVLIFQFMKNNSTNERKVMEKIDGITFIDGPEHVKFSFRMTPEEIEEQQAYYLEKFTQVTQQAQTEHADVLFLDEIVNAVRTGQFPEDRLIAYLESKPDWLEVILSGRDPSDRLIEACDYASQIQKVKHPFDHGQNARKGIEY